MPGAEHPSEPPRLHRRRGAMYAVVIGASALVAAIGLTALTAVRIESRAVTGGGDFLEAMMYAQSAIEMGRYKIRSDSNWRINLPNGVWETNRVIGAGAYTLEGIDPVDGLLANLLNDPLLLVGTGAKGAARYKLQVKLQAAGQPLTCLQSALHSGTALNFNSATVNGSGIVSSNGTANGTSANVSLPAQAVGQITGGQFWGGKTSPVAARTMPDNTVYNSYVANGTEISIGSIPKSQGVATIQNAVLSPTNNPLGGGTSASGIYVIDCKGSSLRIKNSRINATLVVLDPASFTISDSINWQAPTANYPILLVRGNATLSITNVPLVEGINTYPSLMNGLVYVSNTLNTSNNVMITGVVAVATAITVSGTLNLIYSPVYLANPPPGFGTAGGEMQIVAGTWKRVVD